MFFVKGDQLYPSLDVESGPTPVESAKPETVSTGGVGPIGFEGTIINRMRLNDESARVSLT